MRKSFFTYAFAILTLLGALSAYTEPFDKGDRSESCRLQLVSLECVETEGWASADRIYMKFIRNGRTREGGGRVNMNAGDWIDLTGNEPINFDDRIGIELWDDDSFDSDDHLGTDYAYCSYKGAGTKKMSFTEDGAYYILRYKVY